MGPEPFRAFSEEAVIIFLNDEQGVTKLKAIIFSIPYLALFENFPGSGEEMGSKLNELKGTEKLDGTRRQKGVSDFGGLTPTVTGILTP